MQKHLCPQQKMIKDMHPSFQPSGAEAAAAAFFWPLPSSPSIIYPFPPSLSSLVTNSVRPRVREEGGGGAEGEPRKKEKKGRANG